MRRGENQDDQQQQRMVSLSGSCRKIISLEEGWQQIKEKGIDVILRNLEEGGRNSSNSSSSKRKMMTANEYVAVYTIIFDMCSTQPCPYNWSRQLYQRHGETLEEYLTNKVLPSLMEFREEEATAFLTEFHACWCQHQVLNTWMKKIFGYLDRYFVNPKCNPKYPMFPTLLEVGNNHFKSCIYDQVAVHVTEGILCSIPPILRDIRHQVASDTDQSFLRNTVQLYVCLGLEDVYRHGFEKALYPSAREYYADKRVQWLSELKYAVNSPEYIARVQETLADEKIMIRKCLHESSQDAWLEECRHELLGKPSELVLAGDIGTVLLQIMSYIEES